MLRQLNFLLLVMLVIVVSPQRVILSGQRIFPDYCDIFSDMISSTKISWLNKENIIHNDIMLKVYCVQINNFRFPFL